MDYKEIINYVLYTVITVIVPIVGTYVTKYIKSKIDQVDTITANASIQNVIKDATNTVVDAVVSVNQTYVDSVKADGKFDEEAQIKAKNMALTKTITLISADAKEVIETLYSSFDTWIDTQTEKAVKEVKNK